jgi:hypothetical protein
MSEQTQTPEETNPEDQLPTPVLPDTGPVVDDEPMAPPPQVEPPPVAAEDPTPKPKRGRPTKKSKQQSAPQVLSEADSDKWDYDSWINSFDWDQPGMQCKVERISPEMVGTVLTAGHLCTVDNMPLSTRQIQEQYGGGRYHVSVIGPRYSKKTDSVRIMRLSHKALKIPGDPVLSNLGRVGLPSEVAQQRNGRPPGAPSSQQQGSSDPGMVRLVDNMTSHLQRRVDQAGQAGAQHAQLVGSQFQDAAAMKIQAANDMLAEKDRMVASQLQQANARVDEERRRAEEARAEKEKALEEARAAQQRIYDDRKAMEEQFTAKLAAVQGDGSTLIATLIPSIQQNAQNQINTMMSVFQTQVSNQDANYSSRLEGLERSYEQRMAAQADLFKTQMESTRMLFQGQIQHLQTLLTAAQEEKKLLQTQLDDSRNRMMEEIAKVNKAKDPEEQLVKLGGLLETVKSITGLSGSGEDEKVSSGNPFFDTIMNNVGKITEVVPHIAQAVTAKAQADVMQQNPQMMQQMQMQQYPQMHQAPPQLQAPQQEEVDELDEAMQMQPPQPAPQAPQRRRVRRRPPQAQQQVAAEPPKPKGKIPREELDKAVTYINSALGSNPELEPADFASMALSSVDNDMLRRLSRQKSELVVNELESIGVLHGQVSTEPGKAWLCKLLDELRARL